MLTVHVSVKDVHKHGVWRVQPLLRRGPGEHRSSRVQTWRRGRKEGRKERSKEACECFGSFPPLHSTALLLLNWKVKNIWHKYTIMKYISSHTAPLWVLHFTCDTANLPLQVCSHKTSQVSSQTDTYQVNWAQRGSFSLWAQNKSSALQVRYNSIIKTF